MSSTVRIKDQWKEQRLFEQRALIAGVFIGIAACVLIARLVVLQIARHDYYTDLSQGNRVRIEPLPAPRGLILDRGGTVLVENRPAYQLELVREEVSDLDDTLQRLAQLGLIPAGELGEARKMVMSRRGFEGVPIRLRLSDEEIATFAVHRFEFPGVDIRTRLARAYPYGELAVHALGYVGAISEQDLGKIDRSKYAGTTLIGKLGVESAYETDLHGRNGAREILVNAQGRSVQRQGAYVPNLKTTPPVAGRDLVLAMDLRVQQTAETALGPQRGAIVAIDPNNGDVLALVSRPGFDPNTFGRGITRTEYRGLIENIDRPLFNRALRGTYPPGSTVKPMVAMAGLAFQVETPADRVYCRGFFMLPGSRHRFRDWKPAGHGSVAMADAIAQSCDVYFYSLADKIGPTRLAEYLSHFGFGAPTGIDIGGEKNGLLPSPKWKKGAFKRPADQVWFPGETVIFGIGQGYLLATPMQLAHATAILASRGKSYKPRLVKGMRDSESGKVESIAPTLLEEISAVDKDHWQVAVDGMVGVTTRGTARASAAGAPYVIAGKTGTAQVFTVGQNEKYNEKEIDERLRDHAWFIAFAPAEAPKIAVAVLVENGRSGSGVAAPIARKVIDSFLLPPAPPVPATAATPAAPAVGTAAAAAVPARASGGTT